MAMALIPVKSLSNAKSRLASILATDERCALVLAMLETVVTQCLACPKITKVCVITPDPAIAAVTEALGATTVHRHGDAGLNAAIDSGLEWARHFEAGQILILPADIPFLSQSDLSQIFDAANARRPSVLVPCHKGAGTNAVLIPAAACFRPQFGYASFRHHFAQLSALGLNPRALSLPGIAADIDNPEDLVLMADAARQRPMKEILPARGAPCPRS
jgi:2-phospho-L-lactate guanylyltransferase